MDHININISSSDLDAIVKITIRDGTGGPCQDAGKTWTGRLGDAPVTMVIPEWIISARTAVEAAQMRTTIAQALRAGAVYVVISWVTWGLLIELERT